MLRYLHLDVFAATLGGGNHLGVVIGADDWSAVQMQRCARWTALGAWAVETKRARQSDFESDFSIL
ncbi:MAG: hypothetical protein ACYCZD_11965 [Rhodanobacter sp.]